MQIFADDADALCRLANLRNRSAHLCGCSRHERERLSTAMSTPPNEPSTENAPTAHRESEDVEVVEIDGLDLLDPRRLERGGAADDREVGTAELAKGLLRSLAQAAFADDQGDTNVFGMTRMGLIELTRRRRGESLSSQLLTAPDFSAKTPVTRAYDALRDIVRAQQGSPGGLYLEVSDSIAKALEGPVKAALNSIISRWIPFKK